MTVRPTSARVAIPLLVLVLLALLAPIGARADVRFGPALASTASDPVVNAATPAIAGNAAGVVATAYVQTESAITHLYTRVKPAGAAAFAAPQPLGTNNASEPAVAVAADGTITVVWQQANPCAGSSLWIATAAPGAAFGSAVKIADNAFSPHVAVAPDGTVMVLYGHDLGSCKHEERVQIRPAAGSPTDSVLSDAAYGSVGASQAAIGIDDNGTAFAAFPQSLSVSPFTRVLRVARRPAGGPWTATTFTSSHADYSALAVAPDGHAIVANETDGGSGNAIEVRSITSNDSVFGPPQTVTDTSVNEPLGGIAIVNGGAAAVTTSEGHLTMRAAGATSFPTASAPAGLPGSTSGLVPSFTAKGELVLFDIEKPPGSSEYSLVARVQPPTPGVPVGPAQATGLTSTLTGVLALAPFGSNDVAVGWEHRPDAATTFRSGIALGDGTPPVLGAVSAPQSGLAGAPLSFGVTPTDDLGIADVQWSFGDGGQAAGAATTHAFSAPGSSTWAVTASDLVGNTASAGDGLTIQPQSQPQPPVVAPGKLSVRIDQPRRGTRARKLRRLRGTASGPVAGVEVAVVRVRHAGCSSLGPTGRLSKKLRRAGRTGCTAGRFLKASGTTSWTLRLRHRLPAGRYVVFARSRSATGAKSPTARITMTLRK